MADQLGSVIAATNAAGALIGAPNTYDEYGTPAASNTGRFQYTGQIWLAEVGLYHYKARAYAPTLGRFLQTDPILYAGGMNLYMCVGNDPVNFTDPLGLQAWEGNPDDDIIIGPPVSPHWPESRVLWEVWKLFPPHIDGPAGAGEARERVRGREKQGETCRWVQVPQAQSGRAVWDFYASSPIRISVAGVANAFSFNIYSNAVAPDGRDIPNLCDGYGCGVPFAGLLGLIPRTVTQEFRAGGETAGGVYHWRVYEGHIGEAGGIRPAQGPRGRGPVAVAVFRQVCED